MSHPFGPTLSRQLGHGTGSAKCVSGSVSVSEFRAAMVRLDLGLTQEAIDELMHVIDNDGDGELDKVEFLRAMKYIDQNMKRMSYADDY